MKSVDPDKSASWWSRIRAVMKRCVRNVCGPLALGAFTLALTLLAWYWLDQNQRIIAQTKFRLDTRTQVHELTSRTARLVSVTQALEAFYAGSMQVEAEEFSAFCTPYIEGENTIHSLQWVPRVGHGEREAYLEETRQVMGSGFDIVTYDKDGERRLAPDNEYYFPVTFLEASGPTEVAHGFDWGTVPAARFALDAARDRAKAVMTSPLDLPATVDEEARVFVFAPIYEQNLVPVSLDERREKLVGFVAVSSRLSDFFGTVFYEAMRSGLELYLVDVTDDGGPHDLLFPEVRKIGSTTEFLDERVENRTQRRHVVKEQINAVGRTWRVLAIPTSMYVAQRRGPVPLVVLGAGLMLTAVIIGFLLAMMNRARSVEKTVAERTAELQKTNDDLVEKTQALERSQTRLRQAKRSAERASRAKSEFLAHMSHDLRTPLNGILGFATLLGQSELDDAQREQLEVIADSANTLLSLVEQVLDLSHVEAGAVAIAKRPIDLRETVEAALRIHQNAASDKGLTFEVTVDEELPDHVLGDPTRLRQVIDNLVGNAIKFTVEGTVSVDVRERWRTDDDVCTEFVITDTGIGIPEGEREDIFEAFSRVENPLSRQFGGVGLGLTLAHRLVTQMGGRIWLESTIGQGTQFHATIQFGLADPNAPVEQPAPRPRKSQPSERQPDRSQPDESQPDESQPDESQPDESQPDESQPDRSQPDEQGQASPLQVLLVEDAPINRRLILNLLEPAGHQVEVAVDGQEAVDKFEVGKFDVILMDIQLPELSGVEATRLIRQREEGTGERAAIVALTAHAMPGDRDRFLEAGMDKYLSKPIDAKTLWETLETIAADARRDVDAEPPTS